MSNGLVFPIIRGATATTEKAETWEAVRAPKGQERLHQLVELWVPARVLNGWGACFREPYKPK